MQQKMFIRRNQLESCDEMTSHVAQPKLTEQECAQTEVAKKLSDLLK